MVSNDKSQIIKDLIDYINNNFTTTDIPRVKFDELSTTKDSICFTNSEDETSTEYPSDPTGEWVHGVVTINITYRTICISEGNKDLSYLAVLDKIINYIKSIYKNIGDDTYFIDKVTIVSSSKLSTIYSGGVKDYSGVIKLDYEREV